MKRSMWIAVLALIVMSCSDLSTSPGSGSFEMKFSYGVGTKNVLNTFDGTYTKNLIMDGTITVPFTVSDSALQSIRTEMNEIRFFEYPDTFGIPTSDTVVYVTPHSTYIFDVSENSVVKHLYWSDSNMLQDTAAVKLRNLIKLIEDIVESNPKYSQLPPAKGGYQ